MIFFFPGHEVDLSNPSNPAFLSAQIKALEEARNQAKLGQSIPYSSLQAVPGSAASEARQARIHGYIFIYYSFWYFPFEVIYGILKIVLWIKTTVEWVYADDIKVTQSTEPLLLCIDVESFFEGVRLYKFLKLTLICTFGTLIS